MPTQFDDETVAQKPSKPASQRVSQPRQPLRDSHSDSAKSDEGDSKDEEFSDGLM